MAYLETWVLAEEINACDKNAAWGLYWPSEVKDKNLIQSFSA